MRPLNRPKATAECVRRVEVEKKSILTYMTCSMMRSVIEALRLKPTASMLEEFKLKKS
jgi:hypothetical protein